MKRLAFSLSALAALVLVAAAPATRPPATKPAPPKVEVTLSPTELTVGDRVEATLTLRVKTADLTGAPRFPAWRNTWGDAEILEKREPQTIDEEGGVATWQQTLVITAFRPGKVPLPPVAVAVPGRQRTVQAQTPAGLALTVRSVLPANEKNPKPKPPAALRQLPLGSRFWWTLAALSAIALGLGWLLWRQHRAAAAAAPARPALPPFDELVGELDRLQAEPSPLAVHTRLSLALRHYLGRTLSFHAAESTTSEIHRQLFGRRVPGALLRRTVELLRACDLVKFARQEVGEERTRERIAAAREVAREIESHFRPPEPQTEERPEEKLEAAG